jgi:hypothetical protein
MTLVIIINANDELSLNVVTNETYAKLMAISAECTQGTEKFDASNCYQRQLDLLAEGDWKTNILSSHLIMTFNTDGQFNLPEFKNVYVLPSW